MSQTMGPAGWPACEIVDTALRCVSLLVSIYFLWDIKKRQIPPFVVKFRITWTLVILAGVVDRAAYVSGKIYALTLVDMVQLPSSYFAASYLLQHATTSLFSLALTSVPEMLTKFFNVLPIVFSVVTLGILIAWAIEESTALGAVQLLTILLFVALSMGTVAVCYFRLYFYIKRHRQDLEAKFKPNFVNDNDLARVATLKKAGQRALIWSVSFGLFPALACFLIVRQILAQDFFSDEKFVPELCTNFSIVWVTPVLYIAFNFLMMARGALPRKSSRSSKKTSLSDSPKRPVSRAQRSKTQVAPERVTRNSNVFRDGVGVQMAPSSPSTNTASPLASRAHAHARMSPTPSSTTAPLESHAENV